MCRGVRPGIGIQDTVFEIRYRKMHTNVCETRNMYDAMCVR